MDLRSRKCDHRRSEPHRLIDKKLTNTKRSSMKLFMTSCGDTKVEHKASQVSVRNRKKHNNRHKSNRNKLGHGRMNIFETKTRRNHGSNRINTSPKKNNRSNNNNNNSHRLKQHRCPSDRRQSLLRRSQEASSSYSSSTSSSSSSHSSSSVVRLSNCSDISNSSYNGNNFDESHQGTEASGLIAPTKLKQISNCVLDYVKELGLFDEIRMKLLSEIASGEKFASIRQEFSDEIDLFRLNEADLSQTRGKLREQMNSRVSDFKSARSLDNYIGQLIGKHKSEFEQIYKSKASEFLRNKYVIVESKADNKDKKNNNVKETRLLSSNCYR